jgi:hypothetical protein
VSDVANSTESMMNTFLCFAINNFGSGGHPVADAETLHFFNRDYVRQCVRAARASGKLSNEALSFAHDYLTEK